jgi:UDP-N-acetylglucosamine:LPS N-acetylglucosamine transferase
MTWSPVIPTGSTPSGRFGHTCHVYENFRGQKELLVFGGTDGAAVFNDVWSFNTITEKWHHHVVVPDNLMGRILHGSELVDFDLYVFGGKAGATHLNDLVIIDLRKSLYVRLLYTCSL